MNRRWRERVEWILPGALTSLMMTLVVNMVGAVRNYKGVFNAGSFVTGWMISWMIALPVLLTVGAPIKASVRRFLDSWEQSGNE